MEEEKLPRQVRYETFKLYMYYLIIGLVSLISLVFLPMVGSEVGLDWNLPNTTVGWVVWVAIKVIVSVINVLIFYSFMQQAKVNVRDNEAYKEANEILGKVKHKDFVPRSPQKFNSQSYGRKGTTIFITSALTTVALSQAILAYDWMAMLTYLFTIIMGIIFGVLQMKTAEEYWTIEYPRYAKNIIEEMEAKKLDDNNRQQDLQESSGTSSGESGVDQVHSGGEGCTESVRDQGSGSSSDSGGTPDTL